MIEELIVIGREQLVELIEDAVHRAFDEMSNSTTPEWLSTRGLSERYGGHEKTWARLAREGVIRASRVGRAWRFSRADVDAFVEGRGNGQAKP